MDVVGGGLAVEFTHDLLIVEVTYDPLSTLPSLLLHHIGGAPRHQAIQLAPQFKRRG